MKPQQGQHRNYYQQVHDISPNPVHHLAGPPGAQSNQSALTGHNLQAMQSMAQPPQQMQQQLPPVPAQQLGHTARNYAGQHSGNRQHRHNSPAMMTQRPSIVQHNATINPQSGMIHSYYPQTVMPHMIQQFQRQAYGQQQAFWIQAAAYGNPSWQTATQPQFHVLPGHYPVGMNQQPQSVVRQSAPMNIPQQNSGMVQVTQGSGSFTASSEAPAQSNEHVAAYPQIPPPQPRHEETRTKRERKPLAIVNPETKHVYSEEELKSTSQPAPVENLATDPQSDASSQRNAPSVRRLPQTPADDLSSQNQSAMSSEAALEFRDKVSSAALGTAGRTTAENHLPADESKIATNDDVIDDKVEASDVSDVNTVSRQLSELDVSEQQQPQPQPQQQPPPPPEQQQQSAPLASDVNCTVNTENSIVRQELESTQEINSTETAQTDNSNLTEVVRTVPETVNVKEVDASSEMKSVSTTATVSASNEQNGELSNSYPSLTSKVTSEMNLKEDQISSQVNEEIANEAKKADEVPNEENSLSKEEIPIVSKKQVDTSENRSEIAGDVSASADVSATKLDEADVAPTVVDNSGTNSTCEPSSEKMVEKLKVDVVVEMADKSSQLSKDELPSDALKGGKYAYTPDELKKLRTHPESLKKPESLNLTLDIVHDTPVHLRQQEQTDRHHRHANTGVQDMFLPHYINQNRNQSRSSSQQLRQQRAPGPRKIISPSLTQDVKLHKVENAWKPQLKAGETIDEEAKTQELMKAFRGILNKLTPQKYQKLLEEVKKLSIDTESRLQGILELIFDKAVDEPAFCLQYANLCKHLATLQVMNVGEDDVAKPVKFSPLLLTRCQKEFESKMYEGIDVDAKQAVIDQTTDEEKRKILLAELDEEKRKARKRSLGNIKLIGELYKLNMLTPSIMVSCIETLLSDGEEESLECLCTLLRTIGDKLEEDARKREEKQKSAKGILEPYFKIMRNYVDEKKVSARVRFMIQDILDMRDNGWKARKIQDENKPKTIDEIHSEAQEEEKKKIMELQHHSQQKRQESLSKKSGDYRNKSSSQTVNMLKNLKNQSTTDTLQFGPGHAFSGCWSQGARGGSQQKQHDSQMGSNRMSNDSDRKGQNRPMIQGRDSAKGRNQHSDGGRNPIPSQDSDQWVKRPMGRNQATPPFGNDVVVRPRGSRNSSVEKGSAPSSRGGSIKRESQRKEVELKAEEVEKRSFGLIKEYLNCRSIKDAIDSLQSFCNEQNFPTFVSTAVNHALEVSSQNDQYAVGELLSYLVVNKMYSKETFFIGLDTILELAAEVVVDVPKFFEYMGNILSPFFLHVDDYLRKSFFITALRSCIDSGEGGKLMCHLVKSAAHSSSPNKVGSLWRSGGLNWADFLKADVNEEEFVEKNELQFTLSCTESSTNSDIHNNDRNEIEREAFFNRLILDVQQNKSNEYLIENIEKHFQSPDETGDPNFVSALIKSVVRGCVNKCGDTYNPSYTVDTKKLASKCTFLAKYCDNDEEREAKSLYALQRLSEELEHPSKLLNQIFTTLHEENVISYEAFLQWEKADPISQGKGVAIMAVKPFLTWLKETEDSDS